MVGRHFQSVPFPSETTLFRKPFYLGLAFIWTHSHTACCLTVNLYPSFQLSGPLPVTKELFRLHGGGLAIF